MRGPWIASAYYEAAEGADRWTDDGWFRTGDVVTIEPTATSRSTIARRTSSSGAASGSRRVALENALMGHPAVAEAA